LIINFTKIRQDKFLSSTTDTKQREKIVVESIEHQNRSPINFRNWYQTWYR